MTWKPPETDEVIPSSSGWTPPDTDEIVGGDERTPIEEGPSFLGVNRQNLPQTISTIARPVLEIGGSVGGGVLGVPLGPLGIAGGGAVGYAGGKSAADLLDRKLGVMKPIPSLRAAIGETASNIKQGAESEAMGLSVGAPLRAMKKPVAAAFGRLGRTMSGVKQEVGERLFKDPSALVKGPVSRFGKKLGDVRSKLGMVRDVPTEEVFQAEASVSRNKAIEMYEKMKKGTASATDLLEGIQATDDVIEATPMKQRVHRTRLFDKKREFADALNRVAGPERKAAKDYARSMLGSEFRKFLPVTKSGDVSLFRTMGMGALNSDAAKLGAVVPSLLQSPALWGSAISSSGALYKALENPILRRAIMAKIQSMRGKSE